MNSKATGRLLNAIRQAIFDSLQKGESDLVCQQGLALLLAMKDHIDTLEREVARENLNRKYRKAS